MQIGDRSVWQQACGDDGRNYADVCLRWSVILNGPGRHGPFKRKKYQTVGLSARKVTDLNRFAQDMKEGDIVVLRLGTKTAIAVGEIVGKYQWNDGFCDIDGWDLQHVRRVRWFWKRLDSPDRLDTYTFDQGDTTQRLTNSKGIAWLKGKRIQENNSEPLAEISGLNAQKTNFEEIYSTLFDKGVDSASIERLAASMDDLVRLSSWYERAGQKPSEYETVAYLATPFLRALGWTPQRMAIEWNRVDVALFSRLERSAENLAFVVEAKKMDNSCLGAQSQAAGYAVKHGCKQVVVTDGVRYGVFDEFYGKFRLNAYLNLLDLRKNYPVLGNEGEPCGGSAEAIWRMTPESAL